MFREESSLYMNKNDEVLLKANKREEALVDRRLEIAIEQMVSQGSYNSDYLVAVVAANTQCFETQVREALTRLMQRGVLQINKDWTVSACPPQTFTGIRPTNEEFDPVNKPKHYASGKIQPLDAIEDWGLNFGRGQVIKYVSRAGKKDKSKEKEDLQKALFYLSREIANLDKKK